MPFSLPPVRDNVRYYDSVPSRTADFAKDDGAFTFDVFTYYLGGNAVNKPTPKTNARDTKNGAAGWHLSKSIGAKLHSFVTKGIERHIACGEAKLSAFVEPGACHPLHFPSVHDTTQGDTDYEGDTWSRTLMKSGTQLMCCCLV